MRLRTAWRRSLVEPLDPFETHLYEFVHKHRGAHAVFELIAYHLGYSSGGTARGKRIRPQLAFAIVAAEKRPLHDAFDAAAALELLHNYSLVHDDIEDGDTERHWRPTLWAKYGAPQAINAGDALCALSYLALLESERYAPAQAAAMARLLHRANLAMCEGQARDLAFERATSVSMDDYLSMIEGKTAALFRACGQLGALASGLQPQDVEEYAQMGAAFGMAFQIHDDIKGTWGSPERTGKPAGDIARRKWTYPVVWALKSGPRESAETIAAAYGAHGALSSAEVGRVVRALGESGAREAAERECERWLARAETLAARTNLEPKRLRGWLGISPGVAVSTPG